MRQCWRLRAHLQLVLLFRYQPRHCRPPSRLSRPSPMFMSRLMSEAYAAGLLFAAPGVVWPWVAIGVLRLAVIGAGLIEVDTMGIAVAIMAAIGAGAIRPGQ